MGKVVAKKKASLAKVPVREEALVVEAQRIIQDAKRYRWLRNESIHAPDNTPTVFSGTDVGHSGTAYVMEREDLDEAIDKAMNG